MAADGLKTSKSSNEEMSRLRFSGEELRIELIPGGLLVGKRCLPVLEQRDGLARVQRDWLIMVSVKP